MTLEETLLALREESYRDFHRKLVPNLPPETILGVRTPELRRLAKALPQPDRFRKNLPHRYFEENQLHAFSLEREKDFAAVVAQVDAFLPYVDNWATCDQLRPKVFAQHKGALLPHIWAWLASEHEYTVRFAIGMLMVHFLDEDFRPEYLARVAEIRREEYYVRMMAAWYFATALAKQYNAALPYLTEGRLEPWVHNKTIQKALESFRISQERKAYLRTLRRRENP